MRRHWTLLVLVALFAGVVLGGASGAVAEDRTLVVRERHTAVLLEGAFSFRVLKIRGYSIDVAVAGARRTLKLGQSFGPADGTCSIQFMKVSPETRIARFLTACP